MRTVEQILALYTERKKRLDPLQQAAMVVREAYYGDITLAIPELDREDKPLVANLLYQGGEQRAMRVSSTMPDVKYPSKTPGTALQDKRARYRRLVNLAWWDEDRMRIKLRKRARHLVYYASCPVIMKPDMDRHCPTWQVRNPLSTLAPEMEASDLTPPDIIFTLIKSGTWLRQKYPTQYAMLNQKRESDANYVCIEYQDADENVLAVVGEKHNPRPYETMETRPAGEIVELERVPNRVGRCTAVIPGRIGLEHPRGEFDGVVGLWQAQARLMAMQVIGMQRAIWPEEWLVDSPNEEAKIITHADPQHGITGRVTGGALQIVHPLPEAFATNVIDRLERAFRIESGVPAELGGESGSNIRTGRRGDAVLSAVLDFPIQEEQQLMEVALREENKLAIAIDKAYFPKAKTIYLSATAGEIEYEANQLFENDNNYVRYAHAGVDAQGLTVELGQRVGMGTLSLRSAMEMDPLIEDPQLEFDQIMVERTSAGLQQALAQMAADPNMAPIIARIVQETRGEFAIEDAILKVHAEVQAQQAAQAQQAQQQAAQGGMGVPQDPNAQPGMADPQNPQIGAPPQSLGNLTQLLTQLHRGQTAGIGPGPQIQQTG